MAEWWEAEGNYVIMADGERAFVGDGIFNYYDRKSGIIRHIGSDGWCDTTAGWLNGERMCSPQFARKKGWLA